MPPKRPAPKSISLNEEQQAVVSAGLGSWCVQAGPGSGKCLGRGVTVIKRDGSTIPVEKIVEGDFLLGPDGGAKEVLGVSSGVGKLYRVTPVKGDSWVCNEDHILSIQISGKEAEKKYGAYHEISVNDYLFKKHKSFREKAKLWRPAAIERERTEVPIDPYFVGVWLGDGSCNLSGIHITKPDLEIRELMDITAFEWGLSVSTSTNSSKCPTYLLSSGNAKGVPRLGRNPLLSEMRNLFPDGKHIPSIYLFNSIEIRRQILAGLLDTDGHYDHGEFEICTKYRPLADGILFCARSLGLAAYESLKQVWVSGVLNDYYRIIISGDLDEIPIRLPRKKAPPRKQIKSVLRTGFTVDPIGEGEYFGFTLSGDGLFLLGDFTVTHNTATLVQRYVRLIRDGVDPNSAISLSFTKTAAKNLRDRVEAQTGTLSINRTAGCLTFHSLALNFAQEEREAFNFELAEFPLADEVVANKLAGEAARRLEVEPRKLREFSSLQKRRRIRPADSIKAAELSARPAEIKLALAYKAYQKKLVESGVLDFDSLILEMVDILDRKPKVRQRWVYDYLQIDEAQDCAKIEWDLAKLISGKSVLAVGDISQGLYSFRGGDSRLFAEMDQIFPGTKTLYLSCNYRSTPEIIDFIRPHAQSKNLAEKFHTPNSSGPVPRVIGFKSSVEEAEFVVKSIKESP